MEKAKSNTNYKNKLSKTTQKNKSKSIDKTKTSFIVKCMIAIFADTLNTSRIKNDTFYELFLCYVSLHTKMFCIDLENTMLTNEEMKKDYFGPCYQNIRNNCGFNDVNRMLLHYNNLFFDVNINLIDYLNETTQAYFIKMSHVFINDNYNIDNEMDFNIIKYYWVWQFIPVLYKLIYETKQSNVRAEMMNEYNETIGRNSDTVGLHLFGGISRIMQANINLILHYNKADERFHNLVLFIKKLKQIYD